MSIGWKKKKKGQRNPAQQLRRGPLQFDAYGISPNDQRAQDLLWLRRWVLHQGSHFYSIMHWWSQISRLEITAVWIKGTTKSMVTFWQIRLQMICAYCISRGMGSQSSHNCTSQSRRSHNSISPFPCPWIEIYATVCNLYLSRSLSVPHI